MLLQLTTACLARRIRAPTRSYHDDARLQGHVRAARSRTMTIVLVVKGVKLT